MNVKRPLRGLLHFSNNSMFKHAVREEAEGLIRETMERKAAVVKLRLLVEGALY